MPVPAVAAAEQQETPSDPQRGDIIVYGERQNDVLVGVMAEDEIGEAEIAAYGVDTLADLLSEINADLGDDPEGPVVLINGQLATGIDEISDLPAEAAAKIQLLPREAAARLGQRQTRRVVNVVLKRSFDQTTANAERSFATGGKGTATSAGLTNTRIEGVNRTNLSLRGRDTDRLLESDRKVISATGSTPFDFVGNVLPFPQFGSQIDPALSALAGSAVTVAGVPGGQASPSLADFAARANAANISDIGDFRTLIGDSRSLSLNGTLARRLDPKTSATINLRGDLNDGGSLLGPAGALLRLPAGSPFSPFANDVLVSRYLPVPLEQSRDGGSANLGLVVNHNLGKWNLSGSANYNHNESRTRTDRSTDTDALQAAILAGMVSPFVEFPDTFLSITRRDRARSKADNASGQVTLNGTPFDLPAGPVATSFRLGVSTDRLSSLSIRWGVATRTRFRRTQRDGQANIDLPISNRREGVLPWLGDLRVSANVGFRDGAATGAIHSYGYGATWEPIERLALRASFAGDGNPPPSGTLRDPVIETDNVRFFDFLRGETVDVTFVSGGNPAIPNEKRETLTLGGTYSQLFDGRLTVSAEYQRNRNRDILAALPPLSAAIQAAFPDRFIRDASGRLVRVDGRPVTFAREEREQLRWGFNFSQQLRKGPAGARRLGMGSVEADDGEDAGAPPPPPTQPGASPRLGVLDGLRVNLSVAHTWALTNQRLVRAGLPVIDLLRGGASGFSGGQPRHLVQANAGLSARGAGVQASMVYRSATRILAGDVPTSADLRFSARALMNLRAFADLGPLFPGADWAKGTRLTVASNNLFDSKQRVRDRLGETPLRYQAYLLDPLGRTLTVGLRKVF